MALVAATTDLIIPIPVALTAETFTDDDAFEKLYAQIKDAVDQHKPSVSTKGGRDAIASLAHKVARTKTALVKQGKALTAGWREQTNKVNAACNTIEERLDALKETVRRPLNEWENAEEARVNGLKEKLAALSGLASSATGKASAEIRDLLNEANETPLGANFWQEYEAEASFAHKQVVAALTALLEAAEKSEREALELEQLRAEKAERDRAEAERLAVEAAKQAEADRIENERRAAEALKARDERLAEEARAQAERDAQERVAAAERTAKEAQARADREIAAAKEKAERDATAERQRVADEQAREAERQRLRDEDTAHRKEVNNAIVKELIECSGITEAKAQKIVSHLVRGLVPNVVLKY